MKTPLVKIGILTSLIILAVFLILPSKTQATGINKIQRTAVATSTYESTTYSAGGWCRQYMGITPYNTDRDYPYWSFGNQFYTDHHPNCTIQNSTYQTPTTIPSYPNYPDFKLYAIFSGTYPQSNVQIDWGDHLGNTYSTTTLTSQETYSFGGYTYTLVNFNSSLLDTENQGYLNYIGYGSPDIYAILYTATDLLSEINSATDLKNFMDNGMALPAEYSVGSNYIIEAISPTINEHITENPVEFSYRYNDDGSYDIAGYYLNDITAYNSETYEETALTGSNKTFLHYQNVPVIGHIYEFQPYLRKTSNNDVILGPIITFGPEGLQFGTSTTYLGSQIPGLNQLATTTPSELSNECDPNSTYLAYGFCWAISKTFYPDQKSLNYFKNIPGLLFVKFPFSYVSDGLRFLDELTATSTASTSLDINFDMESSSTHATGSLTLINPSALVERFPIITTFRNSLEIVMYVSYGIALLVAVLTIL